MQVGLNIRHNTSNVTFQSIYKKILSGNDWQTSKGNNPQNKGSKNAVNETAVECANQFKPRDSQFDFKYNKDDKTDIWFMKVIEKNTGKTIKQYPSKDYLDYIQMEHKKESLFIDTVI